MRIARIDLRQSEWGEVVESKPALEEMESHEQPCIFMCQSRVVDRDCDAIEFVEVTREALRSRKEIDQAEDVFDHDTSFRCMARRVRASQG